MQIKCYPPQEKNEMTRNADEVTSLSMKEIQENKSWETVKFIEMNKFDSLNLKNKSWAVFIFMFGQRFEEFDCKLCIQIKRQLKLPWPSLWK